jgi:hypothetical protein
MEHQYPLHITVISTDKDFFLSKPLVEKFDPDEKNLDLF